jgi:hypothetical protein
MQTLTISSLNGTNRGVAGVSFAASLNGTIEGRAGVFGTISPSLLPILTAGETSGGGIRSPSPGAGSLKTAIREVDAGAGVTRCCRPGWRSVVPFSFDAFGTFSLMRSFRVPSSSHGVAAVSSLASASSAAVPEGSTKTCIRAFGLGLEDGTGPEPKTSSWG